MKKDSAMLAAALVAAAALLWPRKSNAASIAPGEPSPGANTFPGWEFEGDPYNPPIEQGESVPENLNAIRLGAFLYMIGACETTPADMSSGRAYNRFYGMSLFADMTDHPVLTGEKAGVPLPAEMCRAAGFAPGCVSTAAGAYQINLPTWRQVREVGAWGGRLEDFSPSNQDEAARRVMILAGALDPLERGDFDTALQHASKRWASLPGSTARQGSKSYATVYGLYNSALAV